MDFSELTDEVNAYFAQLDDDEKYAWLIAVFGFLMAMAGIVLIFW